MINNNFFYSTEVTTDDVVSDADADDAVSDDVNSGIELSAEMTDFLSMFKGNEGDVEKALEKYASEDVQDHSTFTIFELKNPKVTAKDGDCYVVELSTDMTTQIFDVCWKDGIVIKMESTEMKAS